MRFRHAEKAVNRDRDKGSSSAAIAIEALRVLLHTVFKVGTWLRTDFGGRNSREIQVCHPEESGKSMSDMRSSTVITF